VARCGSRRWFGSGVASTLRTVAALSLAVSGVAAPEGLLAAERATVPASAAPPDDGRWVMPAKNHASTRYSELAEINKGNVRDLAVAFTFSTGVERGHEAAPIVADDTMFIVTPYPNHVHALDLTQPGAPLK